MCLIEGGEGRCAARLPLMAPKVTGAAIDAALKHAGLVN